MIIYAAIALAFFAAELFYFRIADHYNIIDHPNERSSHTDITIRGGGIVFVLAAMSVGLLYPGYWLPVASILLIGLISFVDDIRALSSGIRLSFHVTAVTFSFQFLNIFAQQSLFVILILYIMVIGIINMYNFMDGINGITGLYSMVVLIGLQVVNTMQVHFISPDVIWLPLTACAVFLFFNFRKKAYCFAGDVGSVTIALWIVVLLLRLILKTHDWAYILFLVVYGVDSVLTISHRLLLRQNIFKAHRLHFYQILANEQGFSHLYIASGYALMQGIVIAAIIALPHCPPSVFFLSTTLPLAVIYVLVKPRLMR